MAGNLNAPVSNSFLESGPRSKVEVGIQRRILIVLYAVVFVAHSEIQNELAASDGQTALKNDVGLVIRPGFPSLRARKIDEAPLGIG